MRAGLSAATGGQASPRSRGGGRAVAWLGALVGLVAISPWPASAETTRPPAQAAASAARPAAISSFGNPAFDEARARFARALGREPGGLDGEVGERLLVLDRPLVSLLIERRWQPPGQGGGNPVERMRTMVELARALRLPAAVGVMQAAFGTPAENGLLELRRAATEARKAAARRPNDRALAQAKAERERALEAALAKLPAFRKAGRDWALADLDLDRDGHVGAGDLKAIESRRKVAAHEPAMLESRE